MHPSTHGSTFGGNPLACATALKVLSIIEKNNLLANVEAMGKLLINQLETKLVDEPLIKQIRGKGLMLGIELNQECPEIVDIALKKNLLINVTAGNVIRILPPLIIDQEQTMQAANIICECIAEFKNKH